MKMPMDIKQFSPASAGGVENQCLCQARVLPRSGHKVTMLVKWPSIRSKLKSQSMAFACLFRGAEREPVVGEISYCYANGAVESCSGHWNPNLTWHEGWMWTQAAYVEDVLSRLAMG